MLLLGSGHGNSMEHDHSQVSFVGAASHRALARSAVRSRPGRRQYSGQAMCKQVVSGHQGAGAIAAPAPQATRPDAARQTPAARLDQPSTKPSGHARARSTSFGLSTWLASPRPRHRRSGQRVRLQAHLARLRVAALTRVSRRGSRASVVHGCWAASGVARALRFLRLRST